MNTELNSAPQLPGCSKDMSEVSNSDATPNSGKHDNNNHAGNRNEQEELTDCTTQTILDENQHGNGAATNDLSMFRIAENVIIEHIELAEGECAETMFESTNSSSFIDEDIDEEDQPMQNNITKTRKVSVMDEWDENEKQQFLTAVQNFGITDIEKIATLIPTKTKDQVENAVNYFKIEAEARISLTANQLRSRPRKNTKKRRREGNPLAEWLHMLNEKFTSEELQTVLGDAFRIIAECEYFPSRSETTNVDFRKVYHAIADALQGRPLPDLSDESSDIIRRALTEVSISVNQYKKKGLCDHITNLTDIRAPLFSTLTEQEKKCPLKVRIANLMTQKRYNPFNIPFKFLDLDSIANDGPNL